MCRKPSNRNNRILDRTNDGDFSFGGSADEVNPPLPERRFASVVDADRARLEAVGERRQEVGNLAPASCPTRASRRTAYRPHASRTMVKNHALRVRLA